MTSDPGEVQRRMVAALNAAGVDVGTANFQVQSGGAGGSLIGYTLDWSVVGTAVVDASLSVWPGATNLDRGIKSWQHTCGVDAVNLGDTRRCTETELSDGGWGESWEALSAAHWDVGMGRSVLRSTMWLPGAVAVHADRAVVTVSVSQNITDGPAVPADEITPFPGGVTAEQLLAVVTDPALAEVVMP